MPKEPSAADTLLLDCIELSQPTALYQSIRKEHYLVSSSFVDSVLIQLLIIIYTGQPYLEFILT